MTKLCEVKLTSQGQISIPKRLREKLHLEKGARILFLEDEQGRVILEGAESPVDFTSGDWDRFLAKTKKEPVTRVNGKKAALGHLDRMIRSK